MTAVRFIAACCSFAITACSAESTPTQLSVRSVYQSQYCGAEASGLRWLSTEEFKNLVRGTGTIQHLNPNPVPTIADAQKLLLISLGQKNSGGHGIALVSDRAFVKEGEVELLLSIEQPAPGSLQTMQLTSPCLVVALPKSGYSRVSAGALGVLQTEQ